VQILYKQFAVRPASQARSCGRIIYNGMSGRRVKTGRVCKPCAPAGAVQPSRAEMYMYLGPKRVDVVKADGGPKLDKNLQKLTRQNYTFYKEKGGDNLYFTTNYARFTSSDTTIAMDVSNPSANKIEETDRPHTLIAEETAIMITKDNMEEHKNDMVTLFLEFIRNKEEKTYTEIRTNYTTAANPENVQDPTTIFKDEYSPDIQGRIDELNQKYENIKKAVSENKVEEIDNRIRENLKTYVEKFNFADYKAKIESIRRDYLQAAKDALAEASTFKSKVKSLKKDADAEVAAKSAHAGEGGDGNSTKKTITYQKMEGDEAKEFLKTFRKTGSYNNKVVPTDQQYLNFSETEYEDIKGKQIKWYIENAEFNPYLFVKKLKGGKEAEYVSEINKTKITVSFKKVSPAKEVAAAGGGEAEAPREKPTPEEPGLDEDGAGGDGSDVKPPSEEKPKIETPPGAKAGDRDKPTVDKKVDPSKLNTIHFNTSAERNEKNWNDIQPLLEAFRDFHNITKDGNPEHGLAPGQSPTYDEENNKVEDWKTSFLDLETPLWTTCMTYDKKVVAVCMCEKHGSKVLKDNTILIDKVYVTQEGQNLKLGLGTQVVKACLQEAHKTFPFTRIFTIVIYENEPALTFFMKNFGMYFTLSEEFIDVEEAFTHKENKADRDTVKDHLTNPMHEWAKRATVDKEELKGDYALEAEITIDNKTNEMSFNGNPATQRFNTILTIIKQYCQKRPTKRKNDITMAPTDMERKNIIHALTLLKALFQSTAKFEKISALPEKQINPLKVWNEASDKNEALEPLADWKPPGI